MTKQKDMYGVPKINFEQQGNLFDVVQYDSTGPYMYDLSKRVVIDPATLAAGTYTEVSVAANSDITWRQLAWTYLGNKADCWWVLLIFNGVQDATLFPADLSADGLAAATIIIPTDAVVRNFLAEIALL